MHQRCGEKRSREQDETPGDGSNKRSALVSAANASDRPQKQWLVQLDDKTWTNFDPGCRFKGEPGEEIRFSRSGWEYMARFESDEEGRQLNVRTGQKRVLRCIAGPVANAGAQASGANAAEGYGDARTPSHGHPMPGASGPSLPTPKPTAIMFADPRKDKDWGRFITSGKQVGVIAFYHPGHDEDWDVKCGAGFCGNFWNSGPNSIGLEAPAWKGSTKYFTNAEAAFQSLKYWQHVDQFRFLSGGEAFKMKKKFAGQEDRSYAGFGSNWKGMIKVLEAKFSDGKYANALIETGDAFLIEHNSTPGRDQIWSNNNLGDGKNWLGLQIMVIRDKLRAAQAKPQTGWKDYIFKDLQLNGDKGEFPLNCAWVWQNVVRDATRATVAACTCQGPYRGPSPSHSRGLSPSHNSGPPLCKTHGCGKPTWDGRPGGFCSKKCKKSNDGR